ncbi:MAG: hypothetical protein IPM74_02440 [Crocinitomicaceae bacterium]|nr:hypothetical protein [Crocinitomicaceae bacterium]MBK8924775.1 hypothetical protein [Crocinitomicaceae bacterium]
MKKAFIVLLVGGVIIFTSCKKEYSCTCTATDPFYDITYYEEMKKKEAQSWCDVKQSSFEAGITGWNCTLN